MTSKKQTIISKILAAAEDRRKTRTQNKIKIYIEGEGVRAI